MFGRVLDMPLLHVKKAAILIDKNTFDYVMEWNVLDVVISYLDVKGNGRQCIKISSEKRFWKEIFSLKSSSTKT